MADRGRTPKSTQSPAAQPSGLFVRQRLFTIAELFAALLLLLIVYFAGRIFLMAFGGLLVAVLLYTLGKWLSDYTPLSYGWALLIVVVLLVSLAGSIFG